jgi:hypothetical protein
MLRTWNVENKGLSGILLWKHDYSARLYPINVEQTKGNMKKIEFIYTLLET